jgi:hypothetical protein
VNVFPLIEARFLRIALPRLLKRAGIKNLGKMEVAGCPLQLASGTGFCAVARPGSCAFVASDVTCRRRLSTQVRLTLTDGEAEVVAFVAGASEYVIAARDLAVLPHLGDRVLEQPLDRAAERASAELRVVPRLCDLVER